MKELAERLRGMWEKQWSFPTWDAKPEGDVPCPVCGKEAGKVVEIAIFDKWSVMPCPNCDASKIPQEITNEKLSIDMAAKIWKDSGIPAIYKRFSPKAIAKEGGKYLADKTLEVLAGYFKNPPTSLWVYNAKSRGGKTASLVAVAKQRLYMDAHEGICNRMGVAFVKFTSLLDILGGRTPIEKDTASALRSIRILIIDDVGQMKHEEDILRFQSMLDDRVGNLRYTYVSSKWSPEDCARGIHYLDPVVTDGFIGFVREQFDVKEWTEAKGIRP